MSVWTGHYLGGFAGSSVPDKEFNWHPLLMTVGLIYLYGTGILVYRVLRNEKKRTLKIVHAVGNECPIIYLCGCLQGTLEACDPRGNRQNGWNARNS